MSLLLGTSVKKTTQIFCFCRSSCCKLYAIIGAPATKGAPVATAATAIPGASATTEEQKYDVLVASDPASASGVIRSRSSCKDPASVATLVSEASRDDHGQRAVANSFLTPSESTVHDESVEGTRAQTVLV